MSLLTIIVVVDESNVEYSLASLSDTVIKSKVIDPSTVEDQMLFVREVHMSWHILSKSSAPDPDIFKMIDMEVSIVYSTVIMLMINTTY